MTRLGRASEAIPYLEEAARQDPASGFGYALLAQAYAGVNRPDDAANAARAAVERATGDAVVDLFAGQAMLRVHRAADAEQYLMVAARLSPADPGVITSLGVAEAALGKRQDAIALFQRVLKVWPDYAPAREALDKLPRDGGPR